MIKVTINDKEVKILLAKIESIIKEAPSMLLRVGLDVNEKIRSRVQDSGVGLDNKKMGKYSVKYGKLRSKKGRDTSIRNLTFTGRMFLSLSARSESAYKVVLGFAGPEVGKVMGNNEKTPFFGIGSEEKKLISGSVDAFFKGKLR